MFFYSTINLYCHEDDFIFPGSLSLSLWSEMMGQAYSNTNYLTGSGANHYITIGGGSPPSSAQERLFVTNEPASPSNYNFSLTAVNTKNSSLARAINASATGLGTAGYFLNTNTSGYAGYFMGRTYISTRLGIGTNTPQTALDVSGNGGSGSISNVLLRLTNQWNSTGLNMPSLQFHNGSSGSPIFWEIGGKVAGSSQLRFRYSEWGTPERTIMYFEGSSGKVSIGNAITSSNDYLLFVQKGIATGKVFVNSSYADYVFLPTYRLPSLEEVRGHIAAEGHLPGMTSQAEIDAAGGFEVGEIAVKQMEKIEELYLYVLQLHDRITELESQLSEAKQDTTSHE